MIFGNRKYVSAKADSAVNHFKQIEINEILLSECFSIEI